VLTDAANASLTIDKIYEPAIAMIRVDNVGTTAYTMLTHYTGNNPTIYVLAGTTIAFDLTLIPGHPFEIQNPLGNPYNTGLVHVSTTGVVSTGADAQGKDTGTLYWRIPETVSGGYRYQCQIHANMVGAITIKRLSVI
jgi:plastocyanin